MAPEMKTTGHWAMAFLALAACSATTGGHGSYEKASAGEKPGDTASGGSAEPQLQLGGGDDDGGEPSCEGMDPALDNDNDGWTGADGDTNDCTAKLNPGA